MRPWSSRPSHRVRLSPAEPLPLCTRDGRRTRPYSALTPCQPVQHLRPEGGVAVPARKVTGPVRCKVGGEDRSATLTICTSGDHRVVAIARHEVSLWLERHPVIATERER